MALVAVAEIADIGRFPDSHRLCAYAGIVPSVHSSGDTTYLGRITKRGSVHLRRAAIACVQGHRKAQPDSDLSRFYDRMQEKGGTSKAMVVTAAKLLRIIYCILKEKRDYIPDMGRGGSGPGE